MAANLLGDKLLGDKLQSKNSVLDTSDALNGKVVAIYFSAHWCPPCRGFTPVLRDVYLKLKEQGKNFEIVFISSDRDQTAFDDYYKDMPWLALPFQDRERKAALCKQFGITGIPSLIIFSSDGTMKERNGRGKISDGGADSFPWFD